MPDSILDEIIGYVKQLLPYAQRREPLAALKERIRRMPPPVNFAESLRRDDIQVIAEVKKASPSAGVIKARMNPVAMAKRYARGGAAAISVLTETKYFSGSLKNLSRIQASLDDEGFARHIKLGRPALLRKDFLVDPYQVYQARAYGADALLLIAAVLSDAQLGDLLSLTRSLGMEALVEVHDPEEAQRALDSGASVVGINNRDLRTFTVDLETTHRLRPLLGHDRVVVSESGIKGRADILKLQSWDVDAVLIGESLMLAPSPEAKLREFRGD